MEYNVLYTVRRLAETAPDRSEPDVAGYYYFLPPSALSTQNYYIYVPPTLGISNMGVYPDG